LSRACLDKMFVFIYIWLKKTPMPRCKVSASTTTKELIQQ
jgi:hypothetical protein